ncbi:suppressor of fused domain protein [Hirschia maritima]|uniref:suppressor of fused domain protein n=1 Tax=Hirschia maritima TaxID=1121961 RepID=UPI000380B982|nr:suppressor of fused domain protein [Hirschia maritima]
MDIWGPETDFGMSSDDMRDALDLHLARNIGEFQTVFTDDDGWAGNSSEDGPPIDVLVVPPEGERKFAYVCSFGCSFAPLPSPQYRENNQVRRVEFVLAAQQKGDEEEDLKALNLAANTVRQFAKLVHINAVAVEEGETVMFSEKPRPVFEGAEFCGFGFVKPLLPGVGFDCMKVEEGDENSFVHFISPVPLYKEEMEISSNQGPEVLCQGLLKAGVSEMIDMQRKCIVPREPLKEEVETPPKSKTIWDKMLSWIGIE